MRIMTIVVLAAAAFGLAGIPSGSAAPVSGKAIAETAQPAATPARAARRHVRRCHRKCYREFVIGRRVCRTYCDWF